MKTPAKHPAITSTPPLILLASAILVLVSFSGGWLAHRTTTPSPVQATSSCLRLHGYTFVSPLLLCNTVNPPLTPQLAALRDNLNSIVQQGIANHAISSASIYFRDPGASTSFSINPSEKFYPASLNKIPTMIAALKMAEEDPSVLDHTLTITDQTDYNKGLEIQPTFYLIPGKTYTVEQAIEAMIKYSDNNAFYALASYIPPTLFSSTFSDLNIPERTSPSQPADYMSAQDFSSFLRILYNASYLSADLSEKALHILSQSDFTQGLAAGIPSGITISHKFGVDTQTNGSMVEARELHDCGIVYTSQKTYLLCVMTKSSGSLSAAENVIKAVSSATYSALAQTQEHS